ncbi:hypothetical protein LguiB_002226 [Lonicera macranthoides]
MMINNSRHLHPPHHLVILLISLCLMSAITKASEYHVLEDAKTTITNRCISREREALLVFKQGIVDDHGRLSSWGSEEDKKDCCQWSGVRCNNQTGHVTMLDLSAQTRSIDGQGTYEIISLEGNISSSILELHHLSYLNLSNNFFGSSEPIPMFIGSLAKLKYLDFSYCMFHGLIPSQLGNLSKLRHLDLRNNGFEPRLYVDNLKWLSNLTSLTYLDVSLIDLSRTIYWIDTITSLPTLSYVALIGCQLSTVRSFHSSVNSSTPIATLLLDGNELKGPIPNTFGNMTSLTHLGLSGNQLEGVIPKSFGNLCNLQTLEMRRNNFSGNLPDFLENFYGCIEGSLRRMILSRNQLKGSVPDITRFSSLRELHLFGNQLDGFLPKEFEQCNALVLVTLSENQIKGPLPDFTGCSSLQELYLHDNEINGSFPEFTGCSSLRELHLYGNQLSGNLHLSIGQLSMLEHLDVSSNFLEGIISEVHLLNLAKLKHLDLSFNNLAIRLSSGWVPPFQLDIIILNSCMLGPRFPRWIRTQTNFSYLDISCTGISDIIPVWFWDLSTRLKTLFASSNKIRGIIPDLSSKFADYPGIDLSFNFFEGPAPLFPSTLTSLNLSGNKFSGGLIFLCAVTDGALSFLDLSYNVLSGGLPECLRQFQELRILILSHNKLSGEIPSSIGDLFSIETMDFQSNNLSGKLPASLINCTLLSFLNIGANKLSGYIPSWVGVNLSNLYVLIMRSNKFSGSIPSHLCFLRYLQLLDLSMNTLSGQIPQCFNNFTAMVQKGISSKVNSHTYVSSYISRNDDGSASLRENGFNDSAVVQWKGRELEFGKVLGQLKSIDLSRNELTGVLPEEIFDLVEMVALNLSHNKLHGVISQQIGQMTSLQSLDLSRNRFSGEIPSSMSNLNFLSFLDLAHNNLAGRIPLGTQLQSFNASQYVGNDELCGPPLTPKCPGDGETPVPPIVAGSEDDDEFYRWFYTGLALGYAVAFWVVSGALLLYRPWRHAYFLLLDNLRDWIYVRIAVRMAKCRLYRGAN